jgi:hypothetical protein
VIPATATTGLSASPTPTNLAAIRESLPREAPNAHLAELGYLDRHVPFAAAR